MLKTIIIDDEQDSLKALEYLLCSHQEEIGLVKSCDNPVQGIAGIRELKPDLVFLDIEMPRMNGFQLLDTIKDISLEIIFITAYNQYAIQAVRYSALDYLLKPIDPVELDSAIKHALHNRQLQESRSRQINALISNLQEENYANHILALPTLEGLTFVKLGEIVRCEAGGPYAKLFLTGRPNLLVSRPLKEFEEILDDNHFFRVHESHIVNLHYAKEYRRGDGGEVVMEDNTHVEVARRRKDEFLKKFNVK